MNCHLTKCRGIDAECQRELWRLHSKRMVKNVYLPFGVGMASLAWAPLVLAFEAPEWVALLSIPGVAWCQWKLAPFLFGSGMLRNSPDRKIGD
jgi:hypothetical protein